MCPQQQQHVRSWDGDEGQDQVSAQTLSLQERRIRWAAVSDWQVVVLAAVRLGCNLDYDQLQDLAENHRSLRGVLGVGDWDQSTHFGWRRIRDTLCMIRPETLQKLNHAIVSYGQELHGDARREVRADSFVIETNIHYPTESSLIWDGVKKMIPLCVALALDLDEPTGTCR